MGGQYYPMSNNNRNQFYSGGPPPKGGYYGGPKGYGKGKYYDMQPEYDYPGYNAPPYHGQYAPGPRFHPNYRYTNPNSHYAAEPPGKYRGGPYQPPPPPQVGQEERAGGEEEPAGELPPPESPPKSPNTTEPDLTQAVHDITAAVAEAAAHGKELSLSQEQQAILQKHQLVVQQYQKDLSDFQQRQLLNKTKASMPNYRLLGRNIFDQPPQKPTFFKVSNSYCFMVVLYKLTGSFDD